MSGPPSSCLAFRVPQNSRRLSPQKGRPVYCRRAVRLFAATGRQAAELPGRRHSRSGRAVVLPQCSTLPLLGPLTQPVPLPLLLPDPPPLTHPPPPRAVHRGSAPLKNFGKIRETLVGPFLVHKILRPRPPDPPPLSNTSTHVRVRVGARSSADACLS